MFLYVSYGIYFLIYESKYVLGTECDVNEMNKCINEFNYYESEAFPNYGENENELDETCEKMNDTLACPSYFNLCENDESCASEDCKQAFTILQSIQNYGTVGIFYEDFCTEGSPLKESYLKHASCLKKSAASYQECYNTSTASFLYMTQERLISDETICCFHTWVVGCYTKETTTACGEDAVDFIKQALGTLKYQFETKCHDAEPCDRPPLPDSTVDEKDGTKIKDISQPETVDRHGNETQGHAKAAVFHGTSVIFVTAFFTLIFS